MTIKINAMSFPQVPPVPHKSLILLGRHCWAAGSAGCSQVIDFIEPPVSAHVSLLLRSRLRPAVGAGAQPTKTASERRQPRPMRVNSIGGEAVGNWWRTGSELVGNSGCAIAAINVTLTVTLTVTSNVTLRSGSVNAAPVTRISDGHCDGLAKVSRLRCEMAAFRQRQAPDTPPPELGVPLEPFQRRGFRPRLLRLRTKNSLGGYQNQNPPRAGIPCARVVVREMVTVPPSRLTRAACAGGDR